MNDADERYWIHSDFGKALVESLAHTADTVPLTMEIVAKTFTDIARLSEICSKPVGLLNVMLSIPQNYLLEIVFPSMAKICQEKVKIFLTEKTRVRMQTSPALHPNIPSYQLRLSQMMLFQQKGSVVSLSKEDVLSLVCCSFFCLYEDRRLNFTEMIFKTSGYPYQHEKLKCFLNYFEIAFKERAQKGSQKITFERKVLVDKVDWMNSNRNLCDFEVRKEGLLEDDDSETLKVDFANKYVGGGVMGHGRVQEEILMTVYPELLAAMIISEYLDDNEVVEIRGVQKFSKYRGYADSFKFAGSLSGEERVDSFVAMDAGMYFGGQSEKEKQYLRSHVQREVEKAYVGFLPSQLASVENEGIATGNWGCGAFGGDPQFKSIIQWLAASQAGRPFVHYYTFGIGELDELEEVVRLVKGKKWTVGKLFSALISYGEERKKKNITENFFSWILSRVRRRFPSIFS